LEPSPNIVSAHWTPLFPAILATAIGLPPPHHLAGRLPASAGPARAVDLGHGRAKAIVAVGVGVVAHSRRRGVQKLLVMPKGRIDQDHLGREQPACDSDLGHPDGDVVFRPGRGVPGQTASVAPFRVFVVEPFLGDV
jgi:hypothetical protein